MRYIETLKIVDGQCMQKDYHSRRAGFDLPDPELGEEFMKGVVKWRLLYSEEGILESSLSLYVRPRIASLRVVDASGVDYGKKYADRRAIEALMAQRGGCDDVIMAKRGWVCDSSFCNLVFENEEGLFTPSTPLLAGTKRQQLLDSGVIRVCDIRVEDIWKYSRVCLVNAMLDLGDGVGVGVGRVV